MDTPGYDIESVSGMTCGGAQVLIFSTGRGTPIGNPLIPVIKVTGNCETYARMSDNIDFDASGAVEGTSTIAELGDHLYRMLEDVCDGAEPAAERLGFDDFSIFHNPRKCGVPAFLMPGSRPAAYMFIYKFDMKREEIDMSTEYMKENGFYEQLEKTAVVPVVVLEKVEDAVPMANALVKGGLPAAEVTFRTAAAADCIREMSEKCPDILVGAGTVVNLEQCKRAVEAGAKFIVSPGYDDAIIDYCLENKVNLIPGAVTPAELTHLINRGFDITKFFPANLYGGLKATETLSAVFVGHRFMPTGGVNLENLPEFLGSKSIIAAGGTWMVKPALFADGDFS